MPPGERLSLWSAVSETGHLATRFLDSPDATNTLGDLYRGSILDGRLKEFRGRSVLIAVKDQFTAALALLELDGIARRLILYPPDLPMEHIDFVAGSAEANAIVSDEGVAKVSREWNPVLRIGSPSIVNAESDRTAVCLTEWVLLTSGTTGRPKMVLHNLASLSGAIDNTLVTRPVVWSTFYDIRRYGGLQIFLRAMLGGGSLVLSSAAEATGAFLERAARRRITHISGTPSHWRRALMSPSAGAIDPHYVRLSGEIADQAILDNLGAFYPQAKISHAFASTEAGVAFEVRDGFAGFPDKLLGQRNAAVELKVEDNILKIRSARTATRYLGPERPPMADADGFVATGDVVELRGGRYYFAGRKDGVINVGGLKVYPEEVEGVINRHPEVRMSLVRTRKSPITGALVVADVVLRSEVKPEDGACSQLEREILGLCREELSRHKIPALIRFVPAVTVGASGKMVRHHA
jgi:acyl-coenzyme A synthetase/AMP-(fatty) acid ligase